jgi:CMP-N-acetylneuraminic acid synthetase
MKTLGIIPARGGSKGVRRKNVRLIAGEPLIAYAIRVAKESRKLTNFLTTTDDEEIAEAASAYGSPVLRRPPELAQDDTPMVPVLLHALADAEGEAGVHYDAIVLLQPTSPIRTGENVDAAIMMLANDPMVDSIISVSPMDDVHPARMYRLDEESWMESLWPEWETVQRQELPTVYYRNGALYATRRSVLVEQKTVMGKRKKAYVIPSKFLLNIDDERDLLIAEPLVQLWKQRRR